MNLSWITYRDLQYLVAVGKHLHFGRAARECHVSQPALSSKIKQIENLLDTTLFERSNRKVLVSPAGQRILEQAKISLQEMDKIAELSKHPSEPLSHSLRLGSIATLGPYLIPHLLAPLRKQYPKLKLLLREGQTKELLKLLEDGELDMILIASNTGEDALQSIPLFFEPFVFTAPKGHPLCKEKKLEIKNLLAHEMVLLQDGHCLKDQVLDICSRNRQKPLSDFQATGLETLRHLVAAGIGYTLFPYLAINHSPAMLDNLMSYKEFKFQKVGREIILAFRKNFAKIQDAEALAKLIRQNLPRGVTPL